MEMTIEQKAAAYDKALERAKTSFESANGIILKKWLVNIFPELAESEDEKIRKVLIEFVHDTTGDELWVDYCVHKEDAIAWLEKQGEQKPVDTAKQEMSDEEYCSLCMDINCDGCPYVDKSKHKEQKPAWSEEDEEMLKLVIKSCEQCGNEYAYYWLKSLKDRCLPQQQEWSEEDDLMKQHCHQMLALLRPNSSELTKDIIDNCHHWLKSLKDRVVPQLKAEWSEKDKNTIKQIIHYLDFARCEHTHNEKINGCISWLKSLRPRTKQEVDEQIETIAMHLDNCGNTAMAEILRSCNLHPQKQWKPSEEQITALDNFIYAKYPDTERYSEPIKSLYNDLKKLREEQL